MSQPVPAEDPAPELRDIVDRPVLRANGPAQIVQLVPYLLGFHPNDSLVLTALRGRRIVASVRNDLDAPIELVTPWCGAVTRAGADAVVGALFRDDVTGVPLPRLDYVAELMDLFHAHDLRVVDVLAVSGGRWWSYLCSEPTCCPPEGTLVDSAGAIAVSAVTEGLVALPNRDVLRDELAVDASAVKRVAAEVAELGDLPIAQRWALIRRWLRRARSRPGITPEAAAGVLLALDDKHVRDATLGFLVDPPDAVVRDAWRRLATMSPTGLRAAPATLYAMWCYAAGDGARTNVGVDVALDADPDYTMAHLLLELQMTGLNPFEVVHDMALEAARVGRRIQRGRHPNGRAGSGGAG